MATMIWPLLLNMNEFGFLYMRLHVHEVHQILEMQKKVQLVPLSIKILIKRTSYHTKINFSDKMYKWLKGHRYTSKVLLPYIS